MLERTRPSIRRLKHGWAGFLAKGAFDEPDPRRVEASASNVDDDVITEWFQLCPMVEHLAEVAERYREAGANQVVFETGPSPELIRSIAHEVLPRLR